MSAEIAGRLTRCGMERPYRKGRKTVGPRAALVEWAD